MFNKLNKMLDKCDLLNYTNNIQQQVTTKTSQSPMAVGERSENEKT